MNPAIRYDVADPVELLKETRRKLDLTQQEMSHIMCVAPHTVYGWEKRIRNPSGSSLEILCLVSKLAARLDPSPDVQKELGRALIREGVAGYVAKKVFF